MHDILTSAETEAVSRALLERLRAKRPRAPLVDAPDPLCAKLLDRARLARSRLPADSPAIELPKLTASQQRLRLQLGRQTLLSRNATLRRAHAEVAKRGDDVPDVDVFDSAIHELIIQATASHFNLTQQQKRHHLGVTNIELETELRLAQSRELADRATLILDGGTFRSDEAREEDATPPLPTSGDDHPAEANHAWKATEELVESSIEHSRRLRALCDQVLAVDVSHPDDEPTLVGS